MLRQLAVGQGTARASVLQPTKRSFCGQGLAGGGGRHSGAAWFTIWPVARMTEAEAGEIWAAMREARVRSLYFGDMLSRFTTRKQWVQGISLGFSSGAVITAIRASWPEVTSLLAAVVAITNVWAISTNLDQKILTLAALRTSWETLRIEYGELWSRWYEDGAADRFAALQRRANDLGVMASSGAPWNPKAVARWEGFVDSELEEGPAPCPSGTN